MAGDHKAFMSVESEFVPFVFRHYSDTKKYMEQYRKVHTKGDIYRRPVSQDYYTINTKLKYALAGPQDIVYEWSPHRKLCGCAEQTNMPELR